VAWSRTQPSETRNSSATSRAALFGISSLVESPCRLIIAPSHGPPVHGLAARRRTSLAFGDEARSVYGCPLHLGTEFQLQVRKAGLGQAAAAFLRVASCFQQSGSHCLFSLFAFEFGQPFRHLFGSEAFEIVFSAGGEGLQCSATWVLARHRRLCTARNSLPRVNRSGFCTGFRAGCLLRSIEPKRISPPWKEMAERRDCTVDPIFFSPSRS